jgi:long-chain acyl-CoA synthetase
MIASELLVVSDIVRRGAARFGPEPALLQSSGSATKGLTYARLARQVDAGAANLRAAEITPGERVLLAMGAGPEWAAAFFSILEAGLVAVPVVPKTPPEALTVVARHARARVAVCDGKTPALASLTGTVRMLPADELLRRRAETPARPRPHPHDLALLAFTSGSTRSPVAVELTHANLLANLAALLQVRRAGPGDAFLSVLPPAHLFELVTGLLGPLACGARVVYAGTLLPNRLIRILRSDRITHALVVPAILDLIYRQVLDQLVAAGHAKPERRAQPVGEIARRLGSEITDAERERVRASVRAALSDSFRTLVVGAAEAMGIELDVGYGLTEAGPIVSLGRSSECPPGSAGRPLPGVELRIDDRGEILVRSASVMRGYHRDPDATAEVLEDGWLHTGDHGHLDGDGFLFVTGRLKEAIVTAAGETVYPDEVEPYYQDPRFAELCVVPQRGPDGNDVPVLVVVPASADVTDEEIETVHARLRANAPPRCRVARVERVAGPLPRTALGKVRRRALAESMAERSAPK